MGEIKLHTGRVLRHAAVVFTVSCVCFGPVLWETHGRTGKQRHFVPLKMYRNRVRVEFAEHRCIIYTPRCVIYTPRCVIYTPKFTRKSVNFRAKFTLQKRVKN